MNCLNEDLRDYACDDQPQLHIVGLKSGLWHMGYTCVGIPDAWRGVWRPSNLSTLRVANYPACQSRGNRIPWCPESYILDIYAGGPSEIWANRH